MKSVFKTIEKIHHYFGWFKLTKRNHKVSTTYGAIETELKQMESKPNSKDVSNAVVLFVKVNYQPKNWVTVEVSSKPNYSQKLRKSKTLHPEMPHYVVSETEVKVPARLVN